MKFRFESESFGEATESGISGESKCFSCNQALLSSPPFGVGQGGAGKSGDGCSILGYGDGLKVVRETNGDDSDMSGEFEFHSLKSLVDGQDTGIKLEMQVVGGAGPSYGTSEHDAVVMVGDDMTCGELPELPAKPV